VPVEISLITLIDDLCCFDFGRYDGGWRTSLPPYQELFPVGSRVRVKLRPFLEQFQRDWKYHHAFSANHLDAAGKMDTVKSSKALAFTTEATFFTDCRRSPVHGTKRV
jgi:hypothetical protein